MKVLIADKLEDSGVQRLRQLGCDVTLQPGPSADALPGVMATISPDILIVRSTKVTAAAIRASAALKLIVRAGAGYDNIDLETASTDGIFVATCPGKNAIAVAELTWALILSCDRRVPEQTMALRQMTWNKKEYSRARGLSGRTLGLIGLGTIALEVAARARAFGMPVVAWSRNLTEERAQAFGVRYAESPRKVAEQSDVLSIHVAANAETKHLIGADVLDALPNGAYVINTSRGSVIDEQALLSAMTKKGLRAGLDVYQGEPAEASGRFEHALAQHEAVCGTHHVGASTDQAQEAIAAEVVRIVGHYQQTGQVLNCVNRAQRSPATCLLTVRHRNRPGVLATVFQVLSEARINVEEMENLLYEGAAAACARIQLGAPPTAEHMAKIRRGCEHILSMELTLLDTASKP